MATEREHRDQAELNHQFLDSFAEEDFPDWAITVRFYIAVHAVQQLMERNSHRVDNHDDRKRVLIESFPHLWKQYQPLYQLSRRVRYFCQRVTVKQLADSETYLERVERIVESELNPRPST